MLWIDPGWCHGTLWTFVSSPRGQAVSARPSREYHLSFSIKWWRRRRFGASTYIIYRVHSRMSRMSCDKIERQYSVLWFIPRIDFGFFWTILLTLRWHETILRLVVRLALLVKNLFPTYAKQYLYLIGSTLRVDQFSAKIFNLLRKCLHLGLHSLPTFEQLSLSVVVIKLINGLSKFVIDSDQLFKIFLKHLVLILEFYVSLLQLLELVFTCKVVLESAHCQLLLYYVIYKHHDHV